MRSHSIAIHSRDRVDPYRLPPPFRPRSCAQGFPPPETRAETFAAHPILQPYSEAERKQLAGLARHTGAQEAMVAILSDVHLDRPRVACLINSPMCFIRSCWPFIILYALASTQVFERLHALFAGFVESGVPPAVFVLMGNFTSHPMGAGSEDLFKLKGASGLVSARALSAQHSCTLFFCTHRAL